MNNNDNSINVHIGARTPEYNPPPMPKTAPAKKKKSIYDGRCLTCKKHDECSEKVRKFVTAARNALKHKAAISDKMGEPKK